LNSLSSEAGERSRTGDKFSVLRCAVKPRFRETLWRYFTNEPLCKDAYAGYNAK